ncbi:unnamed protein product, partial [Trichogramma brassicae]
RANDAVSSPTRPHTYPSHGLRLRLNPGPPHPPVSHSPTMSSAPPPPWSPFESEDPQFKSRTCSMCDTTWPTRTLTGAKVPQEAPYITRTLCPTEWPTTRNGACSYCNVLSNDVKRHTQSDSSTPEITAVQKYSTRQSTYRLHPARPGCIVPQMSLAYGASPGPERLRHLPLTHSASLRRSELNASTRLLCHNLKLLPMITRHPLRQLARRNPRALAALTTRFNGPFKSHRCLL